eukprot:22819-Pleurochrysis_carterae.AAC.1
MLKQLLGKGHPEFSSARQQDALEYYQHVLQVLQRAECAASARFAPTVPPSRIFGFTQARHCGAALASCARAWRRSCLVGAEALRV